MIGQCQRSAFVKEIFAYGQPTARKRKFLLFIKFNKSNLHHQIAMPISHFITTNMHYEDPLGKIFLHRYIFPETKSFYKTQYISGNFCMHIYSIINFYLMKNIIFCIWPMASLEIIAEISAYGQWILQLHVSENIKTDKNYKTHQNHLKMV